MKAKCAFSLLAIWMWMAGVLPIWAQNDTIRSNKTITSVSMIGIGKTAVLDTYLSPETYSGSAVHWLSHTTYEKNGSRFSQQLFQTGSIAYISHPQQKANEISAMYRLKYAWHYNLYFLERKLSLHLGGMIDGHIGAVYNMRNANNPIQAKIGLDLAPTAVTAYRFYLWNRPFMARYELEIPLIGLAFSPHYGQSYYEIFSRGNYDHNIVLTHPVNAPSLSQLMTVDFSLGKTTFRIGYMGEFRQTEINNLKYHSYSNAFVVGVVRKFNHIHIHP